MYLGLSNRYHDNVSHVHTGSFRLAQNRSSFSFCF